MIEVSEKEPVHEGGRERENRIEKLGKLRESGVNPYPYRFQRTHSISNAVNGEESLLSGETEIAVAGRIMSIRGHGHVSFGNIKDDTGAIQFYIKDAEISEKDWKVFKLLDVADIIGVWGVMFRTKTDELTIKVRRLELLSKALLPLPEKYHGLQDKEIRYRQRYIDLIINDDVMKVFRTRTLIMNSIRNYLEEHSFLEVETPVLQPLYGGAMARPFITHHNTLDMKLYLRIADELYLKRLVVGGMERVFEFSRDFRNEGMDRSHNPEFTMLECYAAYWDYNDMMGFLEEMCGRICEEVPVMTNVKFGEYEIDLTPPWLRVTFYGALQEKVGVYLREASEKEIKKVAVENNIDTEGIVGKGALLDELFSKLVEPGLIQPTFITDYPVELSPLAKVHRSEEGLVERFELYIAGLEIANAFSELNDPLEQQARFEEQIRMRDAGADEVHPIDEDYIRALEHGMPPAGGLGVGIDRLVMILTDSPSIRDVILFPQMRPEAGRDER